MTFKVNFIIKDDCSKLKDHKLNLIYVLDKNKDKNNSVTLITSDERNQEKRSIGICGSEDTSS